MLASVTMCDKMRKGRAPTRPFPINYAIEVRMTEATIHYTGPIVTRKEARANGLKRYFTGKPCIFNHVSERLTTNKSCYQCACIKREANRDKANTWFKEYYHNNREREILRNKVKSKTPSYKACIKNTVQAQRKWVN